MNSLSRLTLCGLFAATFSLPVGAMTVEGTLLYQKIPVTAHGLDLTHPVDTPAPQIRVELRDAAKPATVVAQGATDDDGVYRFDVPDDTKPVILFAFSQSGKIQVGDPERGRLYAVSSKAFDPAKAPDLVIPDRDRRSGPFNILAMLRRANRTLEQIEPELPLADLSLTIFWTPARNRGTFFSPDDAVAFINGLRNEDSDEFDDSVVLHEYAHYLADRFSRDDSPGGEHYLGDRLDPRLAWSEGWANFFAQAVLDTPVYLDTLGTDGEDVFGFDLEEDVPGQDQPGCWSEHSVGSALWDLFARADPSSEHVGLGLQPIWRVLREHFPQQVFPYLLTLADGLIEQNGSLDEGVAAVLANREIDYRFGEEPAAPFPLPISAGVSVTGSVDSQTSKRVNLIESAAYYLLHTDGERDVDIQLKVTGSAEPSAADLVLVLYNSAGEIIAATDDQHGVNSLEQLAGPLPAGTYVIGVWSFLPTDTGIRLGSGQYELVADF